MSQPFHIAVIAPYPELARRCLRLAPTCAPHRVTVREGSFNQGVELAREEWEQGADAIVSRSATALAIRQALEVPVAEIAISAGDLFLALTRAVPRAGGRPVALLAERSLLSDPVAVQRALGVPLLEYTFGSREEIPGLVETARQQGAGCLVGGAYATSLAEGLGLPAELIRTGDQAIYSALERARELAALWRRENERHCYFREIIDAVQEGVLAVDGSESIIVFNPVAQRIFGIPPDQALGRPVMEVVPNTCLPRVLRQGLPERGRSQDIGTDRFLLTNRVPIHDQQGQVCGALATFNDITRVRELARAVRRNMREKGHVARFSFADILGQSPALTAALLQAQRYAASDQTLLLSGETGTGKEMVAHAVHNASPRRDGPLVVVDCAALPPSLLESELFGYVEGAFTGARKEGHLGLFPLAGGGTLLLDEVGALAPELQARLLRALEERQIYPVGASQPVPIDVRVLATSNTGLDQAVARGDFRADLYHRLNRLQVVLPPLRQRSEDLPRLARHFLEQAAAPGPPPVLEAEALEVLAHWDWPGNVRELKNLCARLALLCPPSRPLPAPRVRQALVETVSGLDTRQGVLLRLPASLEQLREQIIRQTLENCGGNRTRAAQELGISRVHLWRLLQLLPDAEDLANK